MESCAETEVLQKEISNFQSFAESRTEDHVAASWDPAFPKVSILITTFNHETYIREALLGALGQVTEFPFEIIVRDDASTDETATIVKEFHSRFPGIIRPVLLAQNSSLRVRADQEIRALAQGDYLALCDGDDFWFRSDKIQSQSKILQDNPSVALVHHEAVTLQDADQTFGRIRPDAHIRRDFSSEEGSKGLRLSKPTVMYRNRELPSFGYSRDIAPSMDFVTFQLISNYGSVRFIPGLLGSCKRVHGSNHADGLPTLQKLLAPALTRVFLGKLNIEQGRPREGRALVELGTWSLLHHLHAANLLSNWRVALWSFKAAAFATYRKLIRWRL